jgi:UDP-glucose:(indol-3-yl)acetate beta-D-glucosyltransferase
MAHVLVVPMPGQGHINPMVQFAKKLVSKGVAATLVTTRFIARTARIDAGQVQLDAISDGHDDGGFSSAASPEEYMQKLEVAGSASLAELIRARALSGHPFTCVVYDSFLRWAATTARAMGLPAVPFSTQSCAASAVYHYVNEGKLHVPAAGGEKSAALAGLPEMERREFPTFVFGDGPYGYASLTVPALTQFAEEDEDDWVLFNSFEELEGEVSAKNA